MINVKREAVSIESTYGTPCAVLAVVVLYNRPFKAVPAAPVLKKWLASLEAKSTGLKLARCVIYDNSPVAQSFDAETLYERMDVFHNPLNGGTKAAYLHALSIAKEKGFPWILFLDHDTHLPENFFRAADQALSLVAETEKVCAVVPHVFDAEYPISPSRITNYGRGYTQQAVWNSVREKTTLTAIASASLICTDALASVLPIPDALVLDHLDHWLFREIQRNGERIAVSSARIQHSLSVQSMDTIGVNRYRAILAAELVYLRSSPEYSFITHLSWHVLRTIKVIFSTKRRDLAWACVRAFFKIIQAEGGR